jgi:hypothetical protein
MRRDHPHAGRRLSRMSPAPGGTALGASHMSRGGAVPGRTWGSVSLDFRTGGLLRSPPGPGIPRGILFRAVGALIRLADQALTMGCTSIPSPAPVFKPSESVCRCLNFQGFCGCQWHLSRPPSGRRAYEYQTLSCFPGRRRVCPLPCVFTVVPPKDPQVGEA